MIQTLWLHVSCKAHAVIHCHNNLISEQNREQNLEHWSKSFTSFYPQTNKFISDWQIWDIAAVLDTQIQLCHRIATQSYSTAIISIHRQSAKISLIQQLKVVVTGQDSSRSNKVVGPVTRGFINVIFVPHTEYTRKIIVLRAHNALYWWWYDDVKYCWECN